MTKKKQARTGKQSKGKALPKIQGEGKYTMKELVEKVGKALPKGTFATAGSIVGGALGGPTGAFLGRMAGQTLSGLTGYGEYVLNDIVSVKGKPKLPAADTARTIVHSEYVADLVSQGAGFNCTTFACNIGDSQLHPWGSKIGTNFSRYRYRQFVFEYRSTTSDYVAGGAMGTVSIAPSYNVNMGTPSSKQVLEAQAGAVSSKPSNSLLCGVECDSRLLPQGTYFVRNSQDNAVTQLTDPFEVNVGVNNPSAAAGVTLGELWVHYTVDLYEPQLPVSTTATTLTARYISQNAYTSDNLGGPWYASATSGNSAAALAGVLPSNFILNQYVGAPPPGVSYSLSFDAGDRLKVWFGRAGSWLIDSERLALTGYSAGTGNLWTYIFSDNASTLTRFIDQPAPASGGWQVFKWVITVARPGTSLQLIANATYTPTPSWSGATNIGAFITQLA